MGRRKGTPNSVVEDGCTLTKITQGAGFETWDSGLTWKESRLYHRNAELEAINQSYKLIDYKVN